MSKTAEKSRRTVFLTGMIVGGFVLVNVAVCFPNVFHMVLSKRLWYYVDFRCWPAVLSWNLWILAIAVFVKLVLCLLQYNNIIKRPYSFYLSVITILMLICANVLNYLSPSDLFHIFYQKVYIPYYYGPMASYMYGGSISWKIAIAPATCLLAILILVCLGVMKKPRRKQNGQRNSKS